MKYVATSYMWLFKFKLVKIKHSSKIQFFSHTGYILSAQYPPGGRKLPLCSFVLVSLGGVGALFVKSKY